MVDAGDASAIPIGVVGPTLAYVRQALARFGIHARAERIAVGLTMHPRRDPFALQPCASDADCGTGRCSATVGRTTQGREMCSGDDGGDCGWHPAGYGVGRCPGTTLFCDERAHVAPVGATFDCTDCAFTPFCIPTTMCGRDAYATPDVAIGAPEGAVPAIDRAMTDMVPGGIQAVVGAYLASLAHAVRWHHAHPTVPTAVVVVRAAEDFASECSYDASAAAAAGQAFDAEVRTFVVGGGPNLWVDAVARAGGTTPLRGTGSSLPARLDKALAIVRDELLGR